MDLVDALAFITPRRNGVLATTKRDGRPQLSNITYHLGGDGLIRISITATRAKYANLARTSQASLHVSADDFWAYVVVEADVELAPVAAAPRTMGAAAAVGAEAAAAGGSTRASATGG
jgi:PPOX class probable F420-dependent enzyme